jgi:hypothetical protein
MPAWACVKPRWSSVSARTEAGDYVLMDWKRTKELSRKYTSAYDYMAFPLQHLPDCAGCRAAGILQS